MAASITGTIFNDLNQNGIFNAGDPGIPNAYVQLLFPDGTCEVVQSDATGLYSFTNLTQVGTYVVYESVALPNACPSTVFTQPTGFTNSTTPRKITQPISQIQIDSNTIFTNRNFGHANVTIFNCITEGILVSGNAISTNLSTVDLMTGSSTAIGAITPTAVYNAIGYSIVDNQLYGYDSNTNTVVRISQTGVATLFATIPNLPAGNYNVGDVDSSGHLYIYSTGVGTTNRFYVVDVNPDSATFLKLVDPATGFTEQTSNFGVAIAPQIIFDWAFNPVDGFLYAVSNNGQAIRINPITGAVTNLTTTGLPVIVSPDSYGSAFFDSAGNLYVLRNLNGRIFRVLLTPTTATASIFATTTPGSNSDGARCVLAALNLISVVKAVDKTAANTGDTLTYTMTVTNNSAIPVTGVVLTDPIPAGTTFVPGSVTVGGSPSADLPNTGITIGALAPGASTIVTFKVKIGNTLPNPNPIPNTATVSYDTGVPVDSNTVTTRVFEPSRGVLFL